MAKILVVEDEDELREVIVEELNEMGHITVEAGNGLEGLEQLAAERPDLILSDITMPKMTGYQFLRSVREKHPEHVHTPFIFLTALTERDDQLKGLRLGVDDYLTKPIDFDLMIARIELGLRRSQPQADQMPSPVPSSVNADRRAETTSEKVSEIAAANDGRILTGKFETVSLDAIRERVGDRWSEISDRILTSAEAVIRDHLEPEDAFSITAKQDFIVCFANVTDEQVDAKVGRMRDAIWDRLFGETDDEDLSRVDAQTYELSLELDDTSDVDVVFEEIDELIDEEKIAASEANQRKLHQIYQYEDLFALTLLNPNGTPSKIKMLSFEQRFTDRTRKLFGIGQYEEAFLLGLQEMLFQRLQDMRSLKSTFVNAAMLLPIHFAMIRDHQARGRLIELCSDAEKNIGVDLLIEIIESPDRIKSQKRALKALPIGRKLQFLEIRRTTQIDGVEIDELRELGTAFVSMRYDDVVHHDKQNLRQYIDMLEQGGTKFCIKDIPEGKLFDAQMRKAHLYAMQK